MNIDIIQGFHISIVVNVTPDEMPNTSDIDRT